jgi:regulator of replication initiation timing
VSTQRHDLEDEVERIDGNVNGLFAQISQLKERVEELEAQNEQLRSKLAEAHTKADRALGVAKEVDDGSRPDGGPSKTKRAELISRNEAVRRALVGSGAGGSVTAGEVRDMARPSVDVDYRTVYNAWDALAEKWQGVFRLDERADPKRIVVDRDDLTADLVALVEEDTGRDDLSERFNSRGE